MTAAEFIKQRQGDWLELERLLAASGKQRTLQGSPQTISRFAALYRSICADLARARALGYPDNLVDYLNALAGRSHNLFYVAPPFPLHQLLHFFTRTFPRTVRRNAIYVSCGLILLFGPLLGTVALCIKEPAILYKLVPREDLEGMEKMYERGHAGGREESLDMAMTGFYVQNNIGIAFQCFGAGVFFGLGSIIVLLINGIMIGATAGFVAQTPSAMNLLSFIVGHGPFELTAIALAGGAGLRLGLGPIITGNRQRALSLRLAARDAVILILGAAALLALAALIEGFFSPSALPMAVKFAGGSICAVFLVWYLALFKAGDRTSPSPRGRLVEPGR